MPCTMSSAVDPTNRAGERGADERRRHRVALQLVQMTDRARPLIHLLPTPGLGVGEHAVPVRPPRRRRRCRLHRRSGGADVIELRHRQPPIAHQLANQCRRFRIAPDAAARVHHPFGREQGRPFLPVRHVEGGALVGEKLNHRHGAAAVDRTVQRGLAILVDRVDVIAGFEGQLDRFERFLVRPGALAGSVHADAGRGHQRRGAVVGGESGIGTAFEQQPHQRDVGRFRRHHERRRANPIQHVAVAVARLLGQAGVDVGAAGQQPSHQFEAVERSRSARRRED